MEKSADANISYLKLYFMSMLASDTKKPNRSGCL